MKMARPAERLGTKNKQFRQRVPTDLLPTLRGQSLTVDLPESIEPDSNTFKVSVTISAEVIFSLRTSDKRLATVRHAAALRSVEMFFDAARRGPQDLTHIQLMALLGDAYRQLIAEHRDPPPQFLNRMGGSYGQSSRYGTNLYVKLKKTFPFKLMKRGNGQSQRFAP